MTSLFRRGHYFWTRVPRVDGAAVQRSLGTGDRELAESIARFLSGLQRRAGVQDDWLLGEIAAGRIGAAAAFRAYERNDLGAFLEEAGAIASGWGRDVNLEPYVARWVREMERRKRPTPAVRAKYEQQVRTLVKGEFRRSMLTRPRIRQWLQDLPVGQPNRYRAALSGFCEFLLLEEILRDNPVRSVPASAERPPRDRHLSPAEAHTLVAAMPSPGDRALQALLICTAADVESALAVRLGDINLGAREVFIRGTKKVWRERTCYVYSRWHSLWTHVESFAATVAHEPARAAFAALGNYDTVWKRFRAVSTAVPVPDYTMKDHRHTWAVQAIKDGINVRAVAQQLGHRDATMVLRVYGRHVSRADAYRVNVPGVDHVISQNDRASLPGHSEAQRNPQQSNDPQSGGGEIRTPVLHKIFRNVYARVLSIGVSACWPTGRPHADESAIVSPSGGGRTSGPARICVT
jgi:integrase